MNWLPRHNAVAEPQLAKVNGAMLINYRNDANSGYKSTSISTRFMQTVGIRVACAEEMWSTNFTWIVLDGLKSIRISPTRPHAYNYNDIGSNWLPGPNAVAEPQLAKVNGAMLINYKNDANSGHKSTSIETN